MRDEEPPLGMASCFSDSASPISPPIIESSVDLVVQSPAPLIIRISPIEEASKDEYELRIEVENGLT